MSDTIEPGSPEAAPELPVATTGEMPAPADTTAETAAAEPNAEDAGAEPEAGKPRGGFQKRISELTADKHRAIREAEHWREVAMRGQQPTQPPAQPGKAPETQLPPDLAHAVGPAPRPEDFPAGEFDPGFIRAATRHDMRVDQAQQVMQQRQVQQQQAQADFGKRLNAIVSDGQQKYADFDDAVNSIDALRVPGLGQVVAREIADCEKPAEVAYFLGKNPDAAARLAQAKSPSAVARELAKIEARMASVPPPQSTNAPPPPRPVRGTAATRADPSRMSMEEYARWRNGG